MCVTDWSLVVSGFCGTQDIDLVLRHMNNARYLRELDFARFHFYDRSGIYEAVMTKATGAVQGASSVRYRRAIPIFMPYKITTKVRATSVSPYSCVVSARSQALAVSLESRISFFSQLIYWEDKHFYIEQQFISLLDNFVRAVVLSRQTVTGLKVSLHDIITELEPETRRPEPTKELRLWLESMEESSRSLKKQK